MKKIYFCKKNRFFSERQDSQKQWKTDYCLLLKKERVGEGREKSELRPPDALDRHNFPFLRFSHLKIPKFGL